MYVCFPCVVVLVGACQGTYAHLYMGMRVWMGGCCGWVGCVSVPTNVHMQMYMCVCVSVSQLVYLCLSVCPSFPVCACIYVGFLGCLFNGTNFSM